ncbi:MAG: TonB-dependent receptor [Dyella sp.]
MATAILAALALGCASAGYAQDNAPSSSADTSVDTKDAKKLEAVTVTGSLIPQTQVETAQPVITITAADMKARGFATVAQALQQASFSTGSVQGQSNTNSFTTGAETLSMFGLPVGFTKYLIDGRPMGNFPGLYNGSDTFNSISGIPMDMVDHIDILPGGQSSLYGSDAIAGVINIVLKKHIDAPTIDVRYGWHTGGGGIDKRISFADSFSTGKFNSLIGLQYEETSPIWTGQRGVTDKYFANGTSAPVAERDYLVSSGTGAGYLFEDPANCANVVSGFNGTTVKQHRVNSGDYCGSFNAPRYGTVSNDVKQANLYTHNTLDLSDNIQLYGDLLYNYSEQKYTNGTGTSFWSSQLGPGASGGGYFFDPRLNDLILVQHVFSPEEVGGYQNVMNKQIENSYMLTFGVKGGIGSSNWDYDLGVTHSDDKLINRNFQRFTDPLERYYADHVLGSQLGTYYGYPVFEPNYAALYNPVSRSDYQSFTGYTTDHAKTWDNLLRGQLTNASLFSLPGGDAGLALVVEGGNEGWNSSPDPRLLESTVVNGNVVPYVWGTSATPGAGHRSRYAGTGEFRLPVLKQVTLDASVRYDDYDVAGQSVSHATYNLGLEYRPFESLLLRARYGTAFKAPTLSDEFQGISGNYNSVTDYLNCARLGYGPQSIGNCPTPYNDTQYKGQTEGNPALKPITAKVWSYGFVWAPLERMSISVDYLHWDISNEVAQISADQLSNTQYLCDIGTLNVASSTCTQAFSLITRGPGNGGLLGQITNINTPKLNVANEQVNAISASFNYAHSLGRFGDLGFNASYSDDLKHTYQDYKNDPSIDLFRNPYYSTDYKSKANASVTWSKSKWSTTLYVNRYGSTPNYLATLDNNFTDPGAGRLAPWILWNASVTYSPLSNLDISFLMNNVFNKMPPLDRSYPGTTSTPYNTSNYNVFGRSMYVEAKYKFGATK